MIDFIIINFFVIFAMSASADVRPRSTFSANQKTENAPYQPTGWATSGPSFRYSAPIPHSLYGPPTQEYGPPPEEPTTTEAITTELPTTTDQTNSIPGEGRNQKLIENQGLNSNEETGVYYIYHPSGLLQKVAYTTTDDQGNMAFSAKLRYENVEPVSGPVYTYDPDTYVWKRIN